MSKQELEEGGQRGGPPPPSLVLLPRQRGSGSDHACNCGRPNQARARAMKGQRAGVKNRVTPEGVGHRSTEDGQPTQRGNGTDAHAAPPQPSSSFRLSLGCRTSKDTTSPRWFSVGPNDRPNTHTTLGRGLTNRARPKIRLLCCCCVGACSTLHPSIPIRPSSHTIIHPTQLFTGVRDRAQSNRIERIIIKSPAARRRHHHQQQQQQQHSSVLHPPAVPSAWPPRPAPRPPPRCRSCCPPTTSGRTCRWSSGSSTSTWWRGALVCVSLVSVREYCAARRRWIDRASYQQPTAASRTK